MNSQPQPPITKSDYYSNSSSVVGKVADNGVALALAYRRSITDLTTTTTTTPVEAALLANQAFTPIFERYYPVVFSFARWRNPEQAEDLAQATLLRVWERLHGPEEITNLTGLFYHSYKCEYAGLLKHQFANKRTGGTTTSSSDSNKGKNLAEVSISGGSGTAASSGARDVETCSQAHGVGGDGSNSYGVAPAQARWAGGDFNLSILERVYSEADAPETLVLYEELKQQIVTLVNDEMPHHYRDVLVARLQSQSLSEIAQAQGLTLNQVKKYVVRGRVWLSRALAFNQAI